MKKIQTAGEMIGKVVIGEVAVGYGLNEAIDIISSSLADFISFSGLGIALLIALGLRFIAGGLYGILRARSIDVSDGQIIDVDIEEQEAILLKKGKPLSAWLLRKLNKKRFAKFLKRLAKKGIFSSLLSKLTSKYKHKKFRGATVIKAAKVAKSGKVKSAAKKAGKPKKAKAYAKKADKSAKKGTKAAKKAYAKQMKSQLKQSSKHQSGIRKLAAAIFKKQAKSVDYAFAVSAGKSTTKHYKHEASLHKRASQLAKHMLYLNSQGSKSNKSSQQHKGFFKTASMVKQPSTKDAFKPPVVSAQAS